MVEVAISAPVLVPPGVKDDVVGVGFVDTFRRNRLSSVEISTVHSNRIADESVDGKRVQ